MKPDKHFVGAVVIFLATAGLIALTWVGTIEAVDAQRSESIARVDATLANQALTFTEQINRQLLALDQTLRILVTAWQSNPGRFDLETWRNQAVVLNGLSRDMVLTDENGIVRQSSVVEAIHQNVSNLDYFRALSQQSGSQQSGSLPSGSLPSGSQQTGLDDRIYIGPATIDQIMRQWHMNVARALHYPDGSFAGVIDTDYRIAAISDVFSQTDLGPGAFVTLVGLADGKLRGAVGPTAIDPDVTVSETPMLAAVRAGNSGLWTGPSASDAITRIHAFRHLPDRDLAVVVGMSETEALRPATVWRHQAETFAGLISGLLAGLALLLAQGTRLARKRETAMGADRATLAAANAQLEVARAMANAKAEQLEATLAGMSDGVSMIDAHMCLVEWNAQFPVIAGVPAEILRVGLPMEEILRAQVGSGQFGQIPDAQAEVDRRMVRLRVAPYGVVQRQRPDGHTIELRRNRLPDGGFVTLYADITEHKRAEAALRRAQAEAEAANAAKSRFVATVSHEIRTPLNALLNTVRLLGDSILAPAQQSLLTVARQSADVLFGLINDILDMSQIEAGKLGIRPSLFELRPLLESCVEMFAVQAAEKGITVRIQIAADVPATLLADPARLRQVQLNLLSNAVKYAGPGAVVLTAETGNGPNDAIRLTLRDPGPVISAEARGNLFRPFSRLERAGGGEMTGSGLGLSICRQLMTLMGGDIGCDPWTAEDGTQGNAFWIALPASALPYRMEPGKTGTEAPNNLPVAALSPADAWRRPVSRTRILLAEDVPANRLITATLLRRYGHLVDTVDSGAGAVEAVQRTPYDLIFMDIFMPGMGGQEATQLIRDLSEPARSIPIIALTGNVSAEDEARFSAAGMDGALSKPVSPAELLDVLRRHVWSGQWSGQHPGALSSSSADKREETIPLLSAERIDELRTNLAPATFAELVSECLIDLEHRLPALRRALATDVPGSVTAHAHTMAGMAAAYGMTALEARLREIMAAASGDELSTLAPSVIAGVESDLAESVRRLRAIVEQETV